MGWRALALTLWADWWRRRGHYGHGLRRLRWLAWRDSPDSLRLQRLAQCWRDHGRPLPGRWGRALDAACAAAGNSAREVRNLRRLVLLRDSRAGPRVVAMQEAREAFVAWLQTRAAGGVCVVGNAAGVLERAWGAHIDAHAVVLRFNRWQPPGRDPVLAQGQRLDVWVAAPDCRELPARDPAWAVITGADPLVAMEGWPLVRALRARGVPVVTVPLDIWRGLVDRLEAPPSAGVLMLAWLTTMGLGRGRLHMTGIAEAAASTSHVLGGGHRRGRRHAWDRERALVAQWCAAGLLSPLSPASPAPGDPA